MVLYSIYYVEVILGPYLEVDPEWQPTEEQKLFDIFLNHGLRGEADKPDFLRIIQSPEQAVEEIHQLIADLANRTIIPEYYEHEKRIQVLLSQGYPHETIELTKKSWELVKDFLADEGIILLSHQLEITPIVCGSMLYCDGIKFDLDLALLTLTTTGREIFRDNRFVQARKRLDLQWKDEVQSSLKFPPGIDIETMDIFVITIDQVRAAFTDLQTGTFEVRRILEAIKSIRDISVILCGYPMAEGTDLDALKKEVLSMCQQNGLFAYLAYYPLQECYDARLKREKEQRGQ